LVEEMLLKSFEIGDEIRAVYISDKWKWAKGQTR
jgi:hypothetical protein